MTEDVFRSCSMSLVVHCINCSYSTKPRLKWFFIPGLHFLSLVLLGGGWEGAGGTIVMGSAWPFQCDTGYGGSSLPWAQVDALLLTCMK